MCKHKISKQTGSDSFFASITNDDERNLRNGVSMLSKKSRHLDKTRGQYTLL